MLSSRWPRSPSHGTCSKRFCGSSQSYGRSHHQRQRETFDVMHSRATDRRSAFKCQGKWPDQTLDQAFGLPEVLVAVSTSRLSCKRAGENANIDAGLGFIWRISVQGGLDDRNHDVAMTRRGVLASARAGASAAALGSAPAPAQTGAPKTFVLVHGAWHGGWCWRRVADLLQKGEYKVFTPTMTGVGRALAPHRRQGEPCDPHQRYRQRHQVGKP